MTEVSCMLENVSKIIEIQCETKCSSNDEIELLCESTGEKLSNLNLEISSFMKLYRGIGYSSTYEFLDDASNKHTYEFLDDGSNKHKTTDENTTTGTPS